ncbi:hypothetical protein G6F57_023522 [Rhizopus arrhizus]|nr:hypothetical protein G6F57_023522 [Rhizopus arrhizus]
MHRVQRQAGVAGEVPAQEEAAAFLIAELLGIEDVAAVVEQQAGHAVDDAGTVGAGQVPSDTWASTWQAGRS